MSKRWLCLAALLAIGCKGAGSKVAFPTLSDAPCEPTAPCQKCAAECPAPEKPCEDIHVHVPRSKVHMPRKSLNPTASVAGQPAAARNVTTEHQQIMQTRQVMLVPQQVLVPFVQTTVTGPVRVNGLTETQVMNLAATTTTLTTGAATGQAATSGAAASGTAAGAGAAQAGAAGAVTPQTLEACLAQLRQAQERAVNLEARMQALQAELNRSRSVPPIIVPPLKEPDPGPTVKAPDLPMPRPLPSGPAIEAPTIPLVPQATNK